MTFDSWKRGTVLSMAPSSLIGFYQRGGRFARLRDRRRTLVFTCGMREAESEVGKSMGSRVEDFICCIASHLC